MSKDIRSFFAPIKKAGGSSSSKPDEKVGSRERKRVFNVADSDEEDDFLAKPKSKKGKFQKPKVKTPSPKKNKPERPVDVADFFGKSPIQQKPQTLIKPSDGCKVANDKKEKQSSKSSKNERKKSKGKKNAMEESSQDLEDHFDDDFEETLCQLDEEILGVTPKKETSKSPEKSGSEKKDHDNNKKKEKEINGDRIGKVSPLAVEVVKKITPSKAKRELNVTMKDCQTPKVAVIEHPPSESDPKRKANAEAYQRFLSRGGPRNPGSKPVPKGTPTCLQGKTFVITGVLESLERDEAAELIHQCGGRVTSSVSKKTSYVVIGEEPGESKLKKADHFGIPHLSEDGLLDLIRSFEPQGSAEIVEVESKYFKERKRKDDDIMEVPAKKIKKEDTTNLMKGSSPTSKMLTDVTDSSFKPSTIALKGGESSSSGIGSSVESDCFIPVKNVSSSRSKTVVDVGDFYGKKHLMKNLRENQPSSSGNSSSTESSVNIKPDGEPVIGSQPVAQTLGDSLWVDKYKPKNLKSIIGQTGEKSNVKKLLKWLTDWYKHHGSSEKKKTARPAPWAQGADDGSYYKAALLSGPPGVGKTTSAQLVCQELGYDVVEFNASDTRSKRLLTEHVAELLGSKSIRNFYSAGDKQAKRHVLVMDEVDGMAGNEDRGGIQELIQLIKSTRVPIVCMCNDRNHPKMRSLVNYCFDLRFHRPRVEQIKGAMLSICCKEGIKIPGDALNEMITSANQDVRQVLHNLYLWTIKDKDPTSDQIKADSAKAKKHLKMGPWDVARQVFSSSEQDKMSLRDKEDLFFQDYSLGPLFVQDTYIRVKPYKAKGDKIKTLECLSRAADSLTLGDVVERNIRSQNAWGLLPVQAIFSSVVPGHEMAGHVMGQITFPAWLGKNSKRGRMDRLLQELHVHTRLRTSGSKKAMNLDYSPLLRDAIITPLIKEGSAGVPKSLEVMQTYQLLREDLDSLVELSQWPNKKDPFASIDSKVKAAFTRAYNKESPATPYTPSFSVKKSKVDEAELLEEATREAEEGVIEEDEEVSDDISTDAMIKKGKASTKKIGGKKDEPGTSGEAKVKGSKKGGKASKK